MEEKITANEYRTTVICVDEYDNGVMSGRLFNPYMKGGECFSSLMNLLVSMDNLLDKMRLPQSFEAKRSFVPMKSPPAPADDENRHNGKKATFAVRILFRQNASWQGSVTWLEGKMEESFRSTLELIFLMRSALEGERQEQ
jgi:hypothetical protein